MPEGLKIIYTTCRTTKDARRLARTLLNERLVACSNILPRVNSLYRWKKKVQHDTEVGVLFKTRARRVKAAVKRLRTLHPYDLPAIEVWDVSLTTEEFSAWVRQETKSS